ncbi:MAG: NAD-dependent epimerase/dehydratase family protein, partial [Actinomycetota bacterium]|nr:NAD-dependent epimerase/dehydratase family protein [Actinomycetota bacterium]
MRIAVTGASGLIGSALCESLAAANIQVLKLVRRPVATATEIRWDP